MTLKINLPIFKAIYQYCIHTFHYKLIIYHFYISSNFVFKQVNDNCISICCPFSVVSFFEDLSSCRLIFQLCMNL